MSNSNNADATKVNELILEKLKRYPPAVSELATIAIELAENLPEATVVEALQTTLKDALARNEEVA